MHRITIEVGSHGVVTTVSEMRKRLAKVLSNFPGDQEVFFTFSAHLENSQSNAAEVPCEIWDEMIPEKPRLTGFSVFATGLQAQKFIDELYDRNPCLSQGYVIRPVLTVVMGELARPENS